MKTTKYKRKPFYVDEVRVTEENLSDVATWCKGEVRTTKGKNPQKYIKVKVLRPLNNKQTTAFVGDHVLFSETGGYKVYTHEAFVKSFDTVNADAYVGGTTS